MKKIVQKFDKPGKWKVEIPFTKAGESKQWVGVVDGRKPGEYELRVTAEHKTKGTTGRITVRAVVGAGANVRLYGMIKIGRLAQQTDDFLELRVLELDPSSRAVAEPMLEIEANDVRASHAASIGQIDEEQVQYLRARGCSQRQAEATIVEGFLAG